MKSVSHSKSCSTTVSCSLASIALYIISGPEWKNSRLHVNFENGEVFGQFTVALSSAFATWGKRRDPWSQKLGADYGIGDAVTDGDLLHHGKIHLVSFRGSGVIVRELNITHMLNFAAQSIKQSSFGQWFNALTVESKAKSLIQHLFALFKKTPRGINGLGEIIIPIPTCVGVTPWSYDEVTWHDFAADTHNWMVYAGREWSYKSMSYKLGASACRKMLSKVDYLTKFSPTLKKFDQPLSVPSFVPSGLASAPHQRVARIFNLQAY